MALLEVQDIQVYYGMIQALKGVSFSVNEGEVIALIGANGAGKTTTMHAISGLLKLASGEITYDGNLISKMEAHKIVRLGLAQVPEGRRVFSGLTVQQNLSMGAYTRHDGKDAIQSDYDMVFDLLPRLKERRNQPAGTLSGGEAQKIAIARALYKDAPFIILDEPTAALDPIAEAEIYSKFDEIAGNKTAIYISHRLSSCKFCDEIAVFHEGAVIQQGSHAELLADRGGKYYALWNAQAQYYTE